MNLRDILGKDSVSLDDICWEQFVVLRENGWRIATARMIAPTHATIKDNKSKKIHPDKIRPGKKRPSKKRRHLIAAKSITQAQLGSTLSKYKTRTKRRESPPIEVPLSRDALARLRSRKQFQPSVCNSRNRSDRAGFFLYKGSEKINWNDGSEDGSMWNHEMEQT